MLKMKVSGLLEGVSPLIQEVQGSEDASWMSGEKATDLCVLKMKAAGLVFHLSFQKLIQL